jgi:hypothetical protein
MHVSDFYVRREARRRLRLEGEAALAQARAKLAECRARDDVFAVDAWSRILAEIEELSREPIA